jgi:glycosyltransferase involved in cell wall biosynthesis
MKIPKVSVVMSVYNGERYLCESVDSILSQTFTDLEFIIIDDGSTDETWAILNRYTDPRLVLLRNKSNIGLAASLNRALAIARGRYVARQDADDFSFPPRLERQVAFLDAHPSVGIVGTGRVTVSESGEATNVYHMPASDDRIRAWLLRRSPFCHGTVMVRYHLLCDAGGYRPEFWVAQDYDLWLRLAERCEMANLPEVLYAYRSHRFQTTQLQKNLQKSTIRSHNLASQRPFYGKAKLASQRLLCGKDELGDRVADTTEPLIKRSLAKQRASWGLHLCLQRRWSDGFDLLRDALTSGYIPGRGLLWAILVDDLWFTLAPPLKDKVSRLKRKVVGVLSLLLTVT